MAYYTLCQRSDAGRWAPEFGDYERETVVYELHDYRDHGVKARDLHIVRTSAAKQSQIDAAVAKLNAGVLIGATFGE